MRRVSEKYLDELWRNIVRLMYRGKCAKCKCEGTECHHRIGRADHRHRWHPLNGVLLCFTCHKWAHAMPLEFTEWLKRTLPAVYLHTSTPNEGGYDPHHRRKIKDDLQAILCLMTRKVGHTLAYLPLLFVIVYAILFGIWLLLPE